jgi:hypothetical protein
VIVATAITADEARARLRSRFRPWPRFGLRWSARRAYAADVGADGFVVRALPRVTGSPLVEAVGQWRPEGGATVEISPIATAYMPLVIMNTFFLVVAFATVVLSSMRHDILGTIEGVTIACLILVTVALIVQFAVIALVEWRAGRREREELVRLVREVLGD